MFNITSFHIHTFDFLDDCVLLIECHHIFCQSKYKKYTWADFVFPALGFFCIYKDK